MASTFRQRAIIAVFWTVLTISVIAGDGVVAGLVGDVTRHAELKAGEPKTIELACKPTLSRFCENIHIACAGKSKIETMDLRIVVQEGTARFVDTAYVDSASKLRSSWPSAQLPTTPMPYRVGSNNAYMLFWIRKGQDYIKILDDGRYHQRIYVRNRAYMTYGQCTMQVL